MFWSCNENLLNMKSRICCDYRTTILNNSFFHATTLLSIYHENFFKVTRIRIWTKIKSDRRIGPKNTTDRRICIPLFTPLFTEVGKVWFLAFLGPNDLSIIERCPYHRGVCKERLKLHITKTCFNCYFIHDLLSFSQLKLTKQVFIVMF